MPALSMMDKFIPMILGGRKLHTIRIERENPIKTGDILMIYTGWRTSNAKLQATMVCTAVQRIRILMNEQLVELEEHTDENGETTWHILNEEQLQMFVWRDGFESVREFFEFFMRYDEVTRLERLRVIFFKEIEQEPGSSRPKNTRLRRQPVVHSRDAWFNSLNTWRP